MRQGKIHSRADGGEAALRFSAAVQPANSLKRKAAVLIYPKRLRKSGAFILQYVCGSFLYSVGE